jgi:hypothetical protein
MNAKFDLRQRGQETGVAQKIEAANRAGRTGRIAWRPGERNLAAVVRLGAGGPHPKDATPSRISERRDTTARHCVQVDTGTRNGENGNGGAVPAQTENPRLAAF